MATYFVLGRGEGACEQRVEYHDGLVEIPDEDSFQRVLGRRRRVGGTASSATATFGPCRARRKANERE